MEYDGCSGGAVVPGWCRERYMENSVLMKTVKKESEVNVKV